MGVLADGNAEEYEGAQTTPVKYAVVQNQKRLQSEMELFQESLQDITEGEEPEEVNKALDIILRTGNGEQASNNTGLAQTTVESMDELLSQDTGFEPYTVTEEEIKAEPNMPLGVLASCDWMLE